MINNERVFKVVHAAIDEVNQVLPENQQIKKLTDTSILDNLDSQGLLNFTVAVEDKIEEEFGVEISLTDEKAIMQGHGLFNTIGTVVDYIASNLKK